MNAEITGRAAYNLAMLKAALAGDRTWCDWRDLSEKKKDEWISKGERIVAAVPMRKK